MNSILVHKRILVTGATGLIGSHLVERLLEMGAEVIALGRNEKKLKHVFSKVFNNENISLVAANISERMPEKLGRVDYIFHAASPISGDEIKSRPVDVISANLNGTLNCLDFLKKQKEGSEVNGRLIVFSSATVYTNFGDKDIRVDENRTESAENINSCTAPYSEAKRMAEVTALAYQKQYGIDVVIARIGYVYGYSKICPQTAFYEFILKAVSGEDIVLNHSGIARRDNIYVDDVVNGLLCILRNGSTGEAYNISSNAEKGNFAAADEMAEIVADIVNKQFGHNEIRVMCSTSKIKRKPGVILDNSKIKCLGWTLQTSLYEGISKTVQQYRKDEAHGEK